MKKKQLATYLYSTVGIIAVALIVLALNFIAGRTRQRIDLTAEKAYTLSPGTKEILARIDTPIQIRYYCTKNANAMPLFLATYGQRIDDLLGEYRQASKGQIEIQRLNPEAGLGRGRFGAPGRDRAATNAQRRKNLSWAEHQPARPETNDPVSHARSRATA